MRPEDAAEVERIMSLSDEKIKSELVKDGENPELIAAKCRILFEQAIVKTQAARIEALEAALRAVLTNEIMTARRIARAVLDKDAGE
jgi:hypothetical protein